MKIPVFLVATAALISAAIGLTVTAGSAGASAYPASCSTSVSPYHGGTSTTVFSQHGIAMRRYTKAGMAPLFTASGDVSVAMPEPIWHTAVTTRSTLPSLVNSSRALVGVNGDFFRINSNGAPYGPQVAAGHAIKGLAYGQSAIITTTSGRLTYGKVWLGLAVTHLGHTVAATGLNDPQSWTSGINVYTDRWGTYQPITRSTREYVIGRGVVTAIHYGATHARIPTGGYVVEAFGSTAVVRLQMAGWKMGAHITVAAPVHSSVPGGVRYAIGAGQRMIHNGRAVSTACGYDSPTSRTVVGVASSGRKAVLVQTSAGRGLTTRELIAFLRFAGITEAYALDGGGSSTIATHGHQWSKPQDGTNRAVPNGYGLVPR
jgi:hypothetical protein